MPESPDLNALYRLYSTNQADGIPPYLQQLYPQFLRFWQYLGTGRSRCDWEGPGCEYIPAEDPDCPLNYELKVRWPVEPPEVLPEARTALYRLRDGAGRLLYVGISSDPLRRWPEHAADKPWWPDVADLSMQWFDNRRLALTAEATAIRSEGPIHNIVHNVKTVAFEPSSPSCQGSPHGETDRFVAGAP